MGELTIRRNRGFSVPRYQGTGKVAKQTGTMQSQKTGRTTGLNVSDTLRKLMSMTGETRSRESHRALQKGEVVLDEVQDSLGRMAELAKKAANGGADDRAALQKEFDQLRSSMDRMIRSASVNGVQLFLDDGTGSDEEVEALLYAVMEQSSDQQEASLPEWLMKGIVQCNYGSEQILQGLDKNTTGAQFLAMVTNRPLDENPLGGYAATLYLGAVIANSGSTKDLDPDMALDGLRQLLEMVSSGVPVDEAIDTLTGGEFTSLEDFQEQFVGGSAEGLEDFLANLMLADSGLEGLLDVSATLMDLLAGMEGMNLESLMDLLGQTTMLEPEPGADAQAEQAAVNSETAAQPAANMQIGELQVTGEDLSGISVDAATGALTVSGTSDVVIHGTWEQAIVINSSATVTFQNVTGSVLTANVTDTHIFISGENAIATMQVMEGVTLSIKGTGVLHFGAIQGDKDAVLRIFSGALLARKDAAEPLTIPVILEGPASLAAQASSVRSPEGKALEPFDLIWKTFLPGFSAVTAMELDGKQARMMLMGGDAPTLARLWMEKGDPSHGYPHSLLVRGKDAFGRPKTRYAYLLWSQEAGTFREIRMYPNPFTITGGEESKDWVYEEETHTLYILSDQVTAIAGGAGMDATQVPFSGRLALVDGIGRMELTLGGVVCRVSAGRAFHLGVENDVTLLLQRGSENHFESGAGFAGISLGEGTSLRIDCPDDKGEEPAGALTATGGSGGAGIGRDSNGGQDRTSHILIRGGVITAVGGGGGAGIGAGKKGFMGPVTIVGGIITSTGGSGGGAGIGGALGAPVGDISIRGGTVTAAALYHAAAIGAGVQGASGDIHITGNARIEKAVGGDPGADIGACLFGSCGKVMISGGADIGSARLMQRSGVSLQMGEDIVMLPQFRLSERALQLRKMSLTSEEEARAAGVTLDADRRWVAQIQSVYGAMYSRLEQSDRNLLTAQKSANRERVRDTDAASSLLVDIRQSIPLPSSRAMYTLGQRKIEAVEHLLR